MCNWSLINFSYGSDDDTLITVTPNLDSFIINLEEYKFNFEKRPDYLEVKKQSSNNNNSDITVFATLVTNQREILSARETLKSVCMLLSLASCNWVVPIFEDVRNGGKLYQSILYNHKSYPYIKAKYLINSKGNPSKTLGKFIEITYNKYLELVKKFRIHKVIEYYISAQTTNNTLQESFIKGYVALEVLCKSVMDYAKEQNEILVPGAIQETQDKLKSCFSKLSLDISDEDLRYITNSVAYKAITIKDSQRHLFKKFDIQYNEEILNKLYTTRNELFHGKDNYAYEELLSRKIELYDILDKTILILLGWRGETYISKIDGYVPKILI